jgi:hypothetical protein
MSARVWRNVLTATTAVIASFGVGAIITSVVEARSSRMAPSVNQTQQWLNDFKSDLQSFEQATRKLALAQHRKSEIQEARDAAQAARFRLRVVLNLDDPASARLVAAMDAMLNSGHIHLGDFDTFDNAAQLVLQQKWRIANPSMQTPASINSRQNYAARHVEQFDR